MLFPNASARPAGLGYVHPSGVGTHLSGLLKVVIKGEDTLNTVLLHYFKTYSVSQTPIIIGPILMR